MVKPDIFVSVIVPLQNAEMYVVDYVKELAELLEIHFKDYEIILIDNVCTDTTPVLIVELQQNVQNILCFRLARRVDLDLALTAGLDNCIGDFIITLNPIYDPPHLIPPMVTLGQQGNDVVYGVYTDATFQSQRGFLARALSKQLHRYFQTITGNTIPENFFNYRLLSRQVLNYLLQNEDRHRLLRIIPALGGFRHTQLTYEPLNRPGYPHKTSFLADFVNGIDIIFSASVKPLRLVTVTALSMGVLNLLYTVYILLIAAFKTDVAEGWITLSLQSAGMFFLLSLILAILAEYIFRMMENMYKRPLYQITEERLSNILTHRKRLNVVSSEENSSTQRDSF